MLTAASIVVTVLLWSALIALVVKRWRGRHSKHDTVNNGVVTSLREENQTLRNEITAKDSEHKIRQNENNALHEKRLKEALEKNSAEWDRKLRAELEKHSAEWDRNLKKQLEAKDEECRGKLRSVIHDAGASRNEPLAVELVPTKGKSGEQFLIVTNKGQRQDFRAQCQMLGAPNGKEILNTFSLSWANGAIVGPLSRDESGKLLIAIAGQDRQNELNYIALRTMSGGRWESVEFERWNFGEKPTDIKFRLNITVIGEETQTSKSQDFIVRPGTSCALEMISPGSEPSSTSDLFSPLQLEAFQLARELRIFLKNMGPRPVVEISGEISTVENVRKISEAVRPWLMRVVNTYRADFEDKVNKLVIRLAAENLRDFALDAATKMPNNEKTILDIAELLPLLAVKLDFVDGRKALRRET